MWPDKMKDPTWKYESKLWKRGVALIGGADEVGRGSFAGPVTTAICCFEKRIIPPKGIVVRDSKLMSDTQRTKSSEWIKETAFCWAIGNSSAKEIDTLGIVKATQKAFRRAAKKLANLDFLLVDAFYVPYLSGLPVKNQEAIVKGDRLSYSIAAASILAKVERDLKMQKIASEYPQFGWEKNKGYGTKSHRDAIKKHGLTVYHRRSYSSSSF